LRRSGRLRVNSATPSAIATVRSVMSAPDDQLSSR
jgi:hypothetical protein